VIGTVLLRPDSRVHSTPTYRYAPSAAPPHWWVTEASRTPSTAPSPPVDDPVVEPIPADDVVSADDVVETAVEETVAQVSDDDDVSADAAVRATADEFPWGRQVEADELAWQSSSVDDADGGEGADGAQDGDDVSPGDLASG
jgi:hypothetical protein